MLAATSRLFAFASVFAAVGAFSANAPRATDDSRGQLSGDITLVSGDHYLGTIADTDKPGAIAWQTQFASKPFVFPLEKVKSAVFPSPSAQPNVDEEFCFELHGGQAVFANLVRTGDDEIVIESKRMGRLTLKKDLIARFYRSRGNRSGLGDGLQGLTGWTVEGVAGDWREEAGDLVSEIPGAAISQEITVPARFWVELDAEWNKNYGIQFEFGEVFRIESWKDHIILARDPKAKPLVPAADTKSADWRYTFDKPADGWEKPDFDDSKWDVGKSAFGSSFEPHLGTVWETPDIWIRRSVDIPKSEARPQLYMRHDEDATVYINGVLAARVSDYNGSYEVERISDEAIATIKPKGNVIAVHCHQTIGGQYIDVGFVAGGGGEGDFASISGEGDFASIKRPKGANDLHVRCFVDRQTGEVKVVDLAGNTLSTVKLKPNAPVADAPETIPIRLISYCSHLRVKQLAIGEWDGRETSFAAATGLKVRLKDGELLEADSLEAAEASDDFQLVVGGSRKTLPKEKIESVTFATRDYQSSPKYWLNLHDGAVLSGELKGVKAGKLHLQSSLSANELAIPVSDVRSLANVAAKSPPPVEQSAAPVEQTATGPVAATPEKTPISNGQALLEAEGIVSHGKLMEGAATDSELGMAWQPADSTNAAPLNRDAQVRILFRDEANEAAGPDREQSTLLMLQALGVAAHSANDNTTEPPTADRSPAPGLNGSREYVVLANGDRINCHVKEFDETGLYIECELVSEGFIPADKVRVWETQQQTWLERMDEEKRRRLMTLPRKQREHPPTHMIESVTSDFLRTRLVKGDEENLYAQAQMKERTIPRAVVQRVVWLPPTGSAKKDSSKAAPAGKLPVTTVASRADDAHALLDDARQLSMKVEGLADGKLVGESSILGQCTVDVDSLAELRLGGISPEQVAANSLAKWRLHDAIDPIYMQDQELEENGRLTAGLNFPLVGKPAPDFNAPTLAGDPVKLSELRGRVVVLDFWASWCGPCIQAFPEIVALANSYDESKVRLISVNLGENKETMQACLDRLQLSPTVAMDLDRILAERYQVKSIPQTVVIDAQGNVARVFVGATPQLPKHLRFAIDELLAPKAQ